MNELLDLSEGEFRYIAGMLYERFGIRLGSQKRVLVAGRLTKRVRQLGLDSFSAYFAHVEADHTGAELSELINRITTNHSYFFREREHFDFLAASVLPGFRSALPGRRGSSLRIWSAGCATGEEVYTIAMTLAEFFGADLGSLDHGLLATDISRAALEEACEGVYPETKLRELPRAYRETYFRKLDEERYEIAPALRSMVLFKRLNLMAERFPFSGAFDVIFCRNVMIYFDEASRRRLVDSFHACTKPGGYLFIGHSETLQRLGSRWEYIQPAVYRKAVD
ncbi:MAG: protein-glutamate O-methyltransferase CheR [Spirochaetaceae bacterium]|nr:protein-glutamate O-methyltransferase CheR [Spirochaetaceae bacterium]